MLRTSRVCVCVCVCGASCNIPYRDDRLVVRLGLSWGHGDAALQGRGPISRELLNIPPHDPVELVEALAANGRRPIDAVHRLRHRHGDDHILDDLACALL